LPIYLKLLKNSILANSNLSWLSKLHLLKTFSNTELSRFPILNEDGENITKGKEIHTEDLTVNILDESKYCGEKNNY
jgi:hypothetical protein